ncbi:DUF948 domain-containing protein [bacterium]|nr:DUF948 domain-containing protein [bacterium]
METSQILLNNGLAFLAISTGVMFVVVGGFLIKLIIDMSKLARNVDETTTVVRNELRPTLREVNESLHTLNDFMKSTDKGIDKMRDAMENVFGISSATFSKLKFLSGSLAKGLYKGFSTVVKMFQK